MRCRTYVNLGIVWQGGKSLIQRFVHLLRITLEEATASSDEQSVACKHSSLVAILKEVVGIASARPRLALIVDIHCPRIWLIDREF